VTVPFDGDLGFANQESGVTHLSLIEKADVAVIVPTRNSASTLRVCLESIKRQSHPCTLVVVDNSSSDETRLIADELADLVLDTGPERSAQRNAGAAATAAKFVGFIDSDMELPPEVVGEAIAALRSGAASVVVPELTVGDGFWTEVRAYERTFYQESEGIEAPRFFLREVFDDAGGFDEAMTGAEDWDLGIRTSQAGPRVHTTSVILHHEGQVRYFDACRKKGYYASGLILFAAKHGLAGLGPASRRPWLRQPKALMTRRGLGLLALKIGELVAIINAVLVAKISKRTTPLRGSDK
jgi:glycosyltransferase involved in cell wall biosynthesis